jgi:hypothetical protein
VRVVVGEDEEEVVVVLVVSRVLEVLVEVVVEELKVDDVEEVDNVEEEVDEVEVEEVEVVDGVGMGVSRITVSEVVESCDSKMLVKKSKGLFSSGLCPCLAFKLA